MSSSEKRIILGTTGIEIPPIGIGTWSWGDPEGWGYGSDYDEHDLLEAFQTLLRAGITLFDTAEIYGGGASEKLLGSFIRQAGLQVTVATKFAPLRQRIFGWTMRSALDGSLQRLHLPRVDLYQMHWNTRWVSIERWMNVLAEVQKRGQAIAVGVSNYSLEQMERAATALARHDVSLASNQVEYSLLCRKPETSGLLDACKRNNITMIAYSPLAMGLLTGKYSPGNLPAGTHREKYTNDYLKSIQPLIEEMKGIGNRTGKTLSQIALNWVICKGAVPIPGVKNKVQAEEIIGATGWSLTSKDIKLLDDASNLVT